MQQHKGSQRVSFQLGRHQSAQLGGQPDSFVAQLVADR
jgi:hypothetical protein